MEMYLMSLMNHFIIANSSFSWWGSYLCQNEDKKIIAPKQWFVNKEQNANFIDIYTDDMIVI